MLTALPKEAFLSAGKAGSRGENCAARPAARSVSSDHDTAFGEEIAVEAMMEASLMLAPRAF